MKISLNLCYLYFILEIIDADHITAFKCTEKPVFQSVNTPHIAWSCEKHGISRFVLHTSSVC
uniref:Uncharacterized protein n=1 Tax=Anopheles atroparvus TaxID=41427 RepID=A0AAG5DPZ4_ANOAO